MVSADPPWELMGIETQRTHDCTQPFWDMSFARRIPVARREPVQTADSLGDATERLGGFKSPLAAHMRTQAKP